MGKVMRRRSRQKEECKGFEVVVLGDEYAGTDTINAWVESGMEIYRCSQRNSGNC